MMRLVQMGCARNIAELQDTMTAEEFGLWQTLWNIEPWGDVRTDLAGATIASAVANHAGMTRNSPTTPMDYLPPWAKGADPEPEEVDPVAFFKAMM